MSIKNLLTGMQPSVLNRPGAGKESGLFVGTVTDNKHPENRYSVKVEVKGLHENQATHWARISTIMAGGDRGAFWLPEVGDEVIVAFEAGDSERPLILGALWNGKDKAPESVFTSPDDTELKLPNNDQGGKNNYRVFVSRSGHTLVFSDEDGKEHVSLRTKSSHELILNDTSGKEKIQLYDKDNKQWLEIDVPGKKITLQTDSGEIYVKAKTKITMECEDFILNATKSIKVDSGTTSEWKAGSSMKWEASSTYDMKAGGTMTCKGATIKLN